MLCANGLVQGVEWGLRSDTEGLGHPILTGMKVLYKLAVAVFSPIKEGNWPFKMHPPTHSYTILWVLQRTSLMMESHLFSAPLLIPPLPRYFFVVVGAHL